MGYCETSPSLRLQILRCQPSRTPCDDSPAPSISPASFLLQLQYGNVNMSPSKHATYQRLVALKSCVWRADQLLPELQQLTGADVEVGTVIGGLAAWKGTHWGTAKHASNHLSCLS